MFFLFHLTSICSSPSPSSIFHSVSKCSFSSNTLPQYVPLLHLALSFTLSPNVLSLLPPYLNMFLSFTWLYLSLCLQMFFLFFHLTSICSSPSPSSIFHSVSKCSFSSSTLPQYVPLLHLALSFTLSPNVLSLLPPYLNMFLSFT